MSEHYPGSTSQPLEQQEDPFANVPGFDVAPMNGMDRGATLTTGESRRGGIIGSKNDAFEHGRFINVDGAREVLEGQNLSPNDIRKVLAASEARIALSDMPGAHNEGMGHQKVSVHKNDLRSEKLAGGGMFYGKEAQGERLSNGDYLSLESIRNEMRVLVAAVAEVSPEIEQSRPSIDNAVKETVAERVPARPEAAPNKLGKLKRRLLGAVALVGIAAGLFAPSGSADGTAPKEVASIVNVAGDEYDPVVRSDAPQDTHETVEAPQDTPWVTQSGEGITQVLEREGYDYTLVFEKIGPNGETIEDLLGNDFGGFYQESAAPAGVDNTETRIQSPGAWDPALQQRTIDLLKQAQAVRAQHQ